MNLGHWISKHRLSLAVGLATTALGCLAWLGGALQRLDNFGLDLHFRYFSSIAADPRIVMIDIDDHALESVPYSFPWPRRVFADIVRLLHELGAQAIVLDIVFDTADEPRQVDAALGKNYDIDTELPVIGEAMRGPPIHVYDDDELAAAMAIAGNVYVPMYFELQQPGSLRFPNAAFQRVVDQCKERFDLNEIDILAAQQISDGVEISLAAVKRLAAQELAEEFLAQHPDASFADFYRSALPKRPIDARSFEREELARAYRRSLALRYGRSQWNDAPPLLEDRLPRVVDATLPLNKFIEACKGTGFVGWERETTGPIVRELPLMALFDGKLVPQLGLLTALDVLGADTTNIAVDERQLTILDAQQKKHSLAINHSAESLINWHTTWPGRWSDSFVHVPAARLLEIANGRESMEENDLRVRAKVGELVAQRHESTPSELANYANWVQWRSKFESELRAARTDEKRAAIHDQLKPINKAISEIEKDATEWIIRRWQLWEGQEPKNEQEIAEKKKVESSYEDIFDQQDFQYYMTRLNFEIELNETVLLNELQRVVKNNICFVGYTASAQADLVATPVHSAMPGVMVHANIANTILQNRPAWRAPTSLSLSCLFFLGVLVTLLSCSRGGLFGLGAFAFVFMLTLFVGAYVFRHYVYHLPTIAAAVAMICVWASVTLCRQLIEERSRRRFQSALAQYTSPAIAARIADRASTADLAPRSAVVSCFFADLQGFTTLSEKLGPERTQRILNPYLKAVSDVLIKHNAMVNKFMGDGIFAFFNAPIWPCRDPAAAACRSALAAQRALDDLNKSRIVKEVGAPLKMRIGLSTGEVFVGDYGSDTKLDYTCIGDNVNIAGRLQAANKEFGTGILVDDRTKSDAGNEFSFRPMGDQKLTGKTQTVAVFELTGFAKHNITIDANA